MGKKVKIVLDMQAHWGKKSLFLEGWELRRTPAAHFTSFYGRGKEWISSAIKGCFEEEGEGARVCQQILERTCWVFHFPEYLGLWMEGRGILSPKKRLRGGDRSLDVQSICESMIGAPAYYKTKNQLYLIFSVFITPPTRTHTEVSTKYSSKRRGYTLWMCHFSKVSYFWGFICVLNWVRYLVARGGEIRGV